MTHAMNPELLLNRTRGSQHGPITRLVSPGDLGHQLKPFVFLDAVKLSANGSAGFGWHPHSGIATVTINFEGGSWAEETDQVRHLVPAGGVEWVQAGGGVWHRGGPEPGTDVAAFQLWLALDEDRELEPAASRYFRAEDLPEHGPVRVVLGTFNGTRSPIPAPAGITYLQISLVEGESIALPRPAGSVAFLATHSGGVEVHVGAVNAGSVGGVELVRLAPTTEEQVTLVATSPTWLVYGHAVPHPHPLVIGRYSVHTSERALRVGERGIAKIHEELRPRLGG
jgi:redox-sensitive bicupin YhaK (pirin superfamily)